MRFYRRMENPDRLPLALTVGNFDGVHIGHQAIMALICRIADARGLTAALMTFSPHPQVFFAGRDNYLLTSDSEKLQLIEASGIECLYQLSFDEGLAKTSARDFMQQLIDDMAVAYLLVGEDFRFGYQGQGDVHLLKATCRDLGVTVADAPTVAYQGCRVSSSRVRKAIRAADFELVECLLGKPLCYRGEVVTGRRLGRKIGFPTANIIYPLEQLLPNGVFAVRVKLPGDHYVDGMCNIGYSPTVGVGIRKIEVHLFDFAGELYGQTIAVTPVSKIRDEQKFLNLSALTQQLKVDEASAKMLLAQHSASGQR